MSSVFRVNRMTSHGSFSATHFFGKEVQNYGNFTVIHYSCDLTINYGNFYIANCTKLNLGEFHLMKTGTLNLGGLIIKGNEPLDPEIEKYLRNAGLDFTLKDDCMVIVGNIQLDVSAARKLMPHLFSKYRLDRFYGEEDPITGKYKRVTMVSSESKRTGEEKFWRYAAINANYDLQKAIADVYMGQILHKLVHCSFVTKTKLDVFSKGVVVRDRSSDTCTQDLNAEAENHQLLTFLTHVLITEQQDNISAVLNKLIEPAVMSYTDWFFSLPSLLFSSDSAGKKETKHTHKYTPNDAPKNINRDELIAALTQLIMHAQQDDFKVCVEVEESISKSFTAVNNKFTPEEINQVVIPEIGSLTANLRQNVIAVQKVLVALEAAKAKELEQDTQKRKNAVK